jgi:phosphoglycolate phosphatase
MAVVTARSRRDADGFLARHELAHYFAAIVTRESTRRLKPDPEPVRLAAELLSIPAEHCVMVGDTTLDIVAARRAGAMSVGVLCGFGERAELKRAGADAILEHTSLLPSLLTLPHSGSDDSSPGGLGAGRSPRGAGV